ncbi:MAG: DUF5067 domain-containing protein [Bifidobacteriaceae bacterium]|jgi:hypothetical protein|nr:DUF5067 domain-containing protein [Bifidobacteriaceae bacterium]
MTDNNQQPTPVRPTPPAQPVRPTPPAQPEQQAAPQQAAKGTTASGITALVLGILAAILSFIPIINNFAAFLAVVGIVFGIIGFVATKKTGKKKGRGIAIAGAILSILALVITLVMQSAFSSAIDSATSSAAKDSTSSSASDSTSSKKSDNASDSSDSKATASSGTQKTEGDVAGAHASIKSLAKSANDYNGKPTVLVTVEWKNTSDDNQMITTALNPKAYQKGKSLETAIYTAAPKGYDAQAELTEIKPGATATTILAYVLDDSSTSVEVELSNLFDNSTKITRTFSL